MRRLEAEGLGDLAARPEPMRPECADAVACWNFCGGWEPERAGLYHRLHGPVDLELTLHLMQVIRDHGHE